MAFWGRIAEIYLFGGHAKNPMLRTQTGLDKTPCINRTLAVHGLNCVEHASSLPPKVHDVDEHTSLDKITLMSYIRDCKKTIIPVSDPRLIDE